MNKIMLAFIFLFENIFIEDLTLKKEKLCFIYEFIEKSLCETGYLS